MFFAKKLLQIMWEGLAVKLFETRNLAETGSPGLREETGLKAEWETAEGALSTADTKGALCRLHLCGI